MTTKTTILIVAAAAALAVLLALGAVAALVFLRTSGQPEVQRPAEAVVDSGVPWTSSEVAAADSVEGQLRSQGKRWVKNPGEITVGAYVQDVLEGRMNQPKGRGAIAKVVAISTEENGVRAALVDFGRGVTVGINLSELSLVTVVSE